MAKKKSGPQQFEDYYSELYQERWPQLALALKAPHQVVAFVNPQLLCKVELPSEARELHPFCYQKEGPWERPSSVDTLKNYYLLDYASYLAASLLVDQKKPQNYLDLCAAPGGKSLIIAQLMAQGSTLKCNELSQKRRERLRNVMDEYLEAQLRSQVTVTGHDAGKWCLYEQEAYDAILLDVPCSSERHLMQKTAHLKDWAVGRTKRLSMEQWKFLSSAFIVLKKGGRLLYSTCSISPLENDKVIEKLFAKQGGQVRQIKINLDIGEPTEFGHMILPDRTGHGPLYLSLIEKVSE